MHFRAYGPQREKPPQGEAHVPQLGSSPRLPEREKARTAVKTQQSLNKLIKLLNQKKKKKNLRKEKRLKKERERDLCKAKRSLAG